MKSSFSLHSVGRRIVALSFAISILTGNFWIIYTLFYRQVPHIISTIAFICLVGVFFGGMLLLLNWMLQFKKQR